MVARRRGQVAEVVCVIPLKKPIRKSNGITYITNIFGDIKAVPTESVLSVRKDEFGDLVAVVTTTPDKCDELGGWIERWAGKGTGKVIRKKKEFKCPVCGGVAIPLPGTGYWCKNCGWREKTPPHERMGVFSW